MSGAPTYRTGDEYANPALTSNLTGLGGTFHQQRSSLYPGTLVSLYIFDASPIGGGTYYWVPGPLYGQPVGFGGQAFEPYPVETEGFEWTGSGAPARPKLRIANTAGYVTGLLVAFGDLKGSKLTRIRTLRQFLDGEENADGSAQWAPESWYVNQLTQHDNEYVEWELAMSTDQHGVEIPRRLCLTNCCTHTYRVWTGSAFQYGKASCPYTGNTMFDSSGALTWDPTKDDCGRKLTDCSARFQTTGGAAPALPFRGFPGMIPF